MARGLVGRTWRMAPVSSTGTTASQSVCESTTMSASCLSASARQHCAGPRIPRVMWAVFGLMCTLGAVSAQPLSSTSSPTNASEPSKLGTLSFEAALAQGLAHASNLQVRGMALATARAQQIAAGQLPDPRLSVGVENLPVSGPDAYSLGRDFMTMRRVGWMQDMPNTAKRDAQQSQARALVAREQAMLQAERVAVQRETALAWLALYHAQRRLEAFKAIEQQNRLVLDTVDARVSGGQAQPSDAVMAKQDALMLADRRDDVERDIGKARSALRRWTGLAADAPLAGDPPGWLLRKDAEAMASIEAQQQLAHHAELKAYEPMKQMAQAAVQEAQSEQRGDWGWEVAYSKRGPGYGDMVSFQLSFDLPLWQGTRQVPKILARERELERIEAEQADMLQSHTAETEAQLTDLTSISRALNRLQTSGLPLAQQRVDLTLVSYQGGRSDLSAVLTARRDLAEQRLRLIDLQSQRDALLVRLHYVADAADTASGEQAVSDSTLIPASGSPTP